MTPVPGWLAAKYAKWTESGLTGEVRLRFRHGVVQGFSEDITGQPPAEGMAAGMGCPECARPLTETDYGERQECSACRRSWTIWQLARLRQAASG